MNKILCILGMSLVFFVGCAAFEDKPKFYQGQSVRVIDGFHKNNYGVITDTRYVYTPVPHREYFLKRSKYFLTGEWVEEAYLEEYFGAIDDFRSE